MSVPYETEILELLSEFHEPWVNEQEKAEFDELMLEHVGGIEKISDEIHVGVCNGYTVDFQMKMARKLFEQD